MSMPKIGASATAIERKKRKILRTAVDKTAAPQYFHIFRYDPIIDKRSYTALRRGISYIRQARQIK